MQPIKNLFANLPLPGAEESVEVLLGLPHTRIERIVSQGHTAPAAGWYDQPEHEWVLMLAGAGRLEFEDGSQCLLTPGNAIHIPPHRRHRVSWTDPTAPTVWLAVFVELPAPADLTAMSAPPDPGQP